MKSGGLVVFMDDTMPSCVHLLSMYVLVCVPPKCGDCSVWFFALIHPPNIGWCSGYL